MDLNPNVHTLVLLVGVFNSILAFAASCSSPYGMEKEHLLERFAGAFAAGAM